MVSIIFLFAMAIFAIALYVNNQTAVKPYKNMLLGVTLPYSSLSDNDVTRIVCKYKKMYPVLILTASLFSIPILLFTSYPSISILYMFTWVGALLYLNNKVFMKYTHQLKRLKKENDWFIGNKYIVSVDTEVTRIKNKMPVSWLWFIPSLIISIAPFITPLIKKEEFGTIPMIISLLPVLIELILIYLYKLTLSQGSVVYSNKTEINIACNFLHKRLWSICWVAIANIGSLYFLLASLILSSKYFVTVVLVLAPILFSLVFILCLKYTQEKTRNIQNRLLEATENPVYTDDDEYWQNGYYYNPNDQRTMVEKRIGYGFTVNMATVKGKMLIYGIVGGVTLIALSLFLLFINLDFTDFKLSINEKAVVIDAPFYGYSFNINDIVEMKEVNTIPEGTKTNGASTSKYSVGNFDLNGYGKSKLYIYINNPPFIVIKLTDTYVFINGKTPIETEKYYEKLLDKVD